MHAVPQKFIGGQLPDPCINLHPWLRDMWPLEKANNGYILEYFIQTCCHTDVWWVSRVLCSTRHMTGNFWDESLHTITCTGTDNTKQSRENTQNKQSSPS